MGEITKRQEDYDADELERVASDISDMANSLSSQSAIDSDLPQSLHSLSGDIYDAMPHEVETHYPEGENHD